MVYCYAEPGIVLIILFELPESVHRAGYLMMSHAPGLMTFDLLLDCSILGHSRR
jgi:hypothetical protein